MKTLGHPTADLIGSPWHLHEGNEQATRTVRGL
jgi:hypothetical protein